MQRPENSDQEDFEKKSRSQSCGVQEPEYRYRQQGKTAEEVMKEEMLAYQYSDLSRRNEQIAMASRLHHGDDDNAPRRTQPLLAHQCSDLSHRAEQLVLARETDDDGAP